MADIAQLGIQVKTDGTERATTELNKISGAAARAQAEVEGLTTANRGVTGAASAAAKAYAAEGAAAAAASKQIHLMNVAANQNSAAGRGNLANIAAQFQDIAVSAQMGMGPLQIALQQGTQLAAVLSTMENPVRGLGEAFLSVISPVSLVTIGLIALAAALLQFVDWAKLAQSVLIALADVLEPIAPFAVAAASGLALLYAPTIISGIISLIALLGRLVVQLAIVAGAFALANPAIAFVAGITAAVAAAIVFRDELAEIFGRDIVADAKNGVNFIIGAFVGGFEAIKATWRQLPEALGDLVFQSANSVVKGVEAMINAVSDRINKWISSVNSKLDELPDYLDPGYRVPVTGRVSLGGLYNPHEGKAAGVMGAAQDAYNSAQGTDYVGGVVGAISRGASAASEKLRELAKSLTDVDEKSKKRAGKSEQEKYSDIVAGAERQIAMLEAERDAMGLTERAAAALRYEQEFLNQAQQRGISLTDAQRSELAGLAETMASIEEETRLLGQALDFGKVLTQGFFDDFFAGIERGKSVWRSFGDAALGVLDRIADKLLTDVIDAVFTVSNAGRGGGGLLGLLGGIFGGASQFGIAKAGGIGMYAAGTPAARPGVAWVGEKGPELVRFKGGEEVIPNHRLSGVSPMRAPANQNQSSHSRVHVTVGVNVDRNGNLKAYVQDVAQSVSSSTMRDGLDQYNREVLPGRVSEINNDPYAVG